MGEEIKKYSFTPGEFLEFERRLKAETELLQTWFEQNLFEYTGSNYGFELEGCLLDPDYRPSFSNQEFLKNLNHPQVVSELAKYNIEVNSQPHRLSAELLRHVQDELLEYDKFCRQLAQKMDLHLIWIGILPTLRDTDLTWEHLTPSNRYYALSEQVLRRRKDKPIAIEIEGFDLLERKRNDIMLEAATTSFQIHIQCAEENAVRYFNTAQIISSAMVGICANSPFLFGKKLWSETRIPVFKQAVDMSSIYRNPVTFGRGYIKKSLMELFYENLNEFPTLLPILFDDPPEKLRHLKLKNGTVWRWNRPIIGTNPSGPPHIRIEHRAIPAGPSIVDMTANFAFYIGLMQFYTHAPVDIAARLDFDEAKVNFYEAAKHGLAAQITWEDAKRGDLQSLILNKLLKNAQIGLSQLGIANSDIDNYMTNIIRPRVISGRSGAEWQKAFIEVCGHDFQKLTDIYHEFQTSGHPVHEWKI